MHMSAHRSRIIQGSCWTCRRRRIKCDLQKPACTRCLNSGQSCSYLSTPPIKWVGGCATRGRLAGLIPSADGLAALGQLSTKPMDSSDSLLYFVNTVLPRFQIWDEPINWDVDKAKQQRVLCQTMTAVSQAHYVRYAKMDVYGVLQQKARYAAIEAFRRVLEQGVHSEEAARLLFSINVLFCMLDGMIEPCDESNASICHLRGGWAILHEWPHIPTKMLLDGGLEAHLLSIFATIDLVHALLSGKKPFFDSTTWKMFAGAQTWFGRLETGDRFLKILAALSEMARLGNIVHDNFPLDITGLIEKCLSPIEDMLKKGHVGNSSALEESDLQPCSWDVFCSIYELCAIIYLNRALRRRRADDEAVQDAARRGVETLVTRELPGMMRHCIIFPLLLIGSHCTRAQDCQEVRRVLSPSSSYLSFGNMQLMDEFLLSTWALQPLHETWWETFSTLSQQAFIF